MSNIPRVCIAVDKRAKNNAVVRMAYYQCRDSKKSLCSNFTAVPYSPYSGNFMQRLGKRISDVPVREIRSDLISIGSCPTCTDELFVFPNTARTFSGKKIHCVICSTLFKVKTISADDLSTIDLINEQNEELRDKRLTHDNVDEDGADTSLIHANADDDDDDDDDDAITDDDDDAAAMGDDDDDDEDALDTSDDDDTATITDDDDDTAADDDTLNTADDDDDNSDAVDNSAVNPATPVVPAPVATKPTNTDVIDPNSDPNKPTSTTTEKSGDEVDAEKTPDDDDDDDDEDNLLTDDTDNVVSAAASEFVINCLSRAGDLKTKTLTIAMFGPRLAIIAADGEPIVKLDADEAGDNEKLFAEPEKLGKAFDAIISSCEAKNDFSGNPFKSLGGKAIIYRVQIADEVKSRISSGITAVTASLTAGDTARLDDMKQSLSIAGLIIAKNADKEIVNPLRDKLIAAFTAVNVRNAAAIVDTAMEASSEPFITTLLAKTRELLDKPAAARNEIAKFVERTPYRPVASDKSGNLHRERFTRDSVALSTAAADDNVVLPERVAMATTVEGGKVEHYRKLFRRG